MHEADGAHRSVVVSHWRGPGFPMLDHLSEVARDDVERTFGRGECDVGTSLEVGAFTTVTFTFRIGERGVATGGRLGVCWRWPFDWGDLQAGDASGDGHASLQVDAADGVRLAFDYHRMGGVEPWHHVVEVDVVEGSLRRGDVVRLTCGDRGGGGRGWRAPTCAAAATGFVMMIDPDGTQVEGATRWYRLPDPPPFALVTGVARRLVVVAPSHAAVGEPVGVVARLEDGWGNPVPWPGRGGDGAMAAGVELICADLHGRPVAGALGQLEAAAHDPRSRRLLVTFRRPGTFELRAGIEGPGGPRFEATSDPVVVAAARPRLATFWGDLHAGQVATGCGAGTIDEHYRYAQHVAGVDFVTEQSNDHYVTREAWRDLRRAAEAFDRPGSFVTFLGCEWSPETEAGGDRNVVYRHDEPRLVRSGRYFQERDPDPTPDAPTAPAFHRTFGGREVLVNVHVGGRMTNLAWFDDTIERLCEIHSTHGTIEWFAEEVIRRGHLVGITAGTDGVMGRPSADTPGWGLIRNLPNGLTAVLAERLDRPALWEALRERRCYATTGPRIVLAFSCDGQPMGSLLERDDPPRFAIAATGTAPIEAVDLLRGTDPIASWRFGEPVPATGGRRSLQVLWSGTRARGSAQAQRLVWDGSLRVDGGRIVEAVPVGFYGRADELSVQDERSVTWRSATAGNEAGARVLIEGDDATTCAFSSPPCSFEFTLGEVALEGRTVEAGEVARRVRVGPALAGAPRSVELEAVDTELAAGRTPYWVRLTQVDRAKAWSSPIYVQARGARRGGA